MTFGGFWQQTFKVEKIEKKSEKTKKSEARGKNKIALFAKSGLVTESLSFHVFQPK
jgi:hypothetical protein